MNGDFLGSKLDEHAATRPDSPSLIFRQGEWTYRRLWEESNRISSLLSERGVSPGDRVALLLGNSPWYAACFHGVLRAGAVLVPLNPRSSAAEAIDLITRTEATLTIAEPGFASALGELVAAGRMRSFVLCDRDAGGDGGQEREPIERGLDLFAALEGLPSGPPEHTVDPASPAIVFFTSGTTGKPKGAVCTHTNCVAAVEAWIDRLSIGPSSRSLMLTPWFHNAYNAFVHTLHRAGGSAVVLPTFYPRTVLRMIGEAEPTLLFGTPATYISLLDTAASAETQLDSVRTVVYGAAPMPRETIRRLQQVFPCDLYNAYAQSETCPAISCLAPQHALAKAPSVGRPVKGVSLKILDEEGAPLAPMEVGEICCRGANVMSGYYGAPEATKDTIRDGWLRTGDQGYIDEDGFLFLVGRKDDLIISGGENIYPKEVEDVLFQHEDILDVAVIGVPDRLRGQVLAAFVVLTRSATADIAALGEFCRSRLARHKVPRYTYPLDRMPRNPSGKVLKTELAARHERRTGEGNPQAPER